MISFMARQARHDRDQPIAISPELVGRLTQRFLKTFVVSMSLFSAFASVAHGNDQLTTTELQGRKIYREGSDGSNSEITATLGLIPEDSVPATTFTCANCHGLEGEGKQEGGLTVPAITSQRLFDNTTSGPHPKQSYNDATLTQAITKGVNAQNKALSAAMPRYHLTGNQAQALMAYLKRLGSASDVDAGVTTSEVQLASLLPLSGALENTGNILKATLDACVAEANRLALFMAVKLL